MTYFSIKHVMARCANSLIRHFKYYCYGFDVLKFQILELIYFLYKQSPIAAISVVEMKITDDSCFGKCDDKQMVNYREGADKE